METEPLPAADAGTVIPPSSVSLPSVTITKEVCDQIVGDARCDIVGSLFTENAMSQSSTDRKNVVKSAIMLACPRFSALNGEYS